MAVEARMTLRPLGANWVCVGAVNQARVIGGTQVFRKI